MSSLVHLAHMLTHGPWYSGLAKVIMIIVIIISSRCLCTLEQSNFTRSQCHSNARIEPFQAWMCAIQSNCFGSFGCVNKYLFKNFSNGIITYLCCWDSVGIRKVVIYYCITTVFTSSFLNVVDKFMLCKTVLQIYSAEH